MVNCYLNSLNVLHVVKSVAKWIDGKTSPIWGAAFANQNLLFALFLLSLIPSFEFVRVQWRSYACNDDTCLNQANDVSNVATVATQMFARAIFAKPTSVIAILHTSYKPSNSQLNRKINKHGTQFCFLIISNIDAWRMQYSLIMRGKLFIM